MSRLKPADNLGHFKWKIKTTPPPHFNDGKMARFALRANSSLILGGGGGLISHFILSKIVDGRAATTCGKDEVWPSPDGSIVLGGTGINYFVDFMEGLIIMHSYI